MSIQKHMPLGPVMVDVAGVSLTPEERVRLMHPQVGGVILFTRNYDSPEQLKALTAEIHALRNPTLIIAVDHEGGRVQRFRSGFTVLPSMSALGRLWDKNRHHARDVARDVGYVLAAELRAGGVDLSFAPVLDRDHGRSSVIGDRAFHKDLNAIVELARGLIEGLHEGGMTSVGKHFPGHGWVEADSHLDIPVDDRTYDDIQRDDLPAFARVIETGLGGIMPAHVVYPEIDDKPAGFSEIWIRKVLRGELGFQGVIFSDDLSMEGARIAGDIVQRANAALGAGCDMVLVCNDPDAAGRLLAGLHYTMPAIALVRLARMHGRADAPTAVGLRESGRYVAALRSMDSVGLDSGDLPLA
jgi:beta-N-acetylhexosaminidase